MQKYFILIICSLSLTACIKTPTLSNAQRPANWGRSLNPNHNFYQIADQVFRSEQPNIFMLPQLKKHHITHIINLRNSRDDFALLDENQYHITHIPINTWQIQRDDLLKVMQSIQSAQQRGEKTLIHCYHGSDRTGASIAMYRIIFQNWTIEQATAEMKHGGYGFHRIWKNIEQLFTPENVAWIREQMKLTSK